MRMVVDSNYLESEDLRKYLASSRTNYLVLTDYAAMEAYKPAAPESIHQRMKIPCDFPEQVLVLRGTQHACGLTGDAVKIAEKMVDKKQTAEFTKYCDALALARSGNQRIQKQIMENHREVQRHLSIIANDSKVLALAISYIEKGFDAQELKIMRRPDQFTTQQIIEKQQEYIFYLSMQLMYNHPAVKSIPPALEATDRFLFRIALCSFLLAAWWISKGGADRASEAKLLNDQVDITFAAFATYYDGLFTNDRRLTSIFEEAKLWLDIRFSRRG